MGYRGKVEERARARELPHPHKLRKEAEIERCRVEAEEWVGELSERDLAMYAIALYAGEGSKTEGAVKFANSDPRLMRLFTHWFRRHFDVDETRLRVRLYLHADLDLDAATSFWSDQLDVPVTQFTKPYRAEVRPTFRTNRHRYGCATISYSCRTTHRRLMAMVDAVSLAPRSGVAQLAVASDC